MIYILDGYNLLFSLTDSKESLSFRRENLILYLQKKFSSLHMSGIIVFDGAHRRDEESGLSYKSPLEIAYAPKGQSADAYIVEKIEVSANPKLITVVTNDRGLSAHARSNRAKVLSNQPFIKILQKKRTKKTVKPETPHSIDRLLKIFEERLKSGDEE